MTKCDFGSRQVEYFGHVISSGKVQMDKKKIDSIVDWHVPKNIKELRGFLGLTRYCKRFIKGFGTIARPLTKLLKKNNFKWHDGPTATFEQLRKAIVTGPILAFPNFK